MDFFLKKEMTSLTTLDSRLSQLRSSLDASSD
jgi:hypothetical protein